MHIHAPFGRTLLTVQAQPTATDAIRPVTIDIGQVTTMDFVQHGFGGPTVYIQVSSGDRYIVTGADAESLALHFNPGTEPNAPPTIPERAEDALLTAMAAIIRTRPAILRLTRAIRGHTSDRAAADTALEALESAKEHLEHGAAVLGIDHITERALEALERSQDPEGTEVNP